MFCPKCGSEVQADVKFCNSCGTPIGQSAPPRAFDAASHTAAMPAIGGHQLNSRMVLGIVGGIVALVVIFLLVSGPGNNPEGIAKAFTESLYKGNFTKAAEYCAPGFKEEVLAAQYFGAILSKTEKQPDSYSVTVSSDTSASVKVYDQNHSSLGTVRLIKYDGKWLVSNF